MDDGSRAERRDDEFAHWYAAHHDRIRALSTRILRDRAAAEDVTQETLLRAWERRSTLRDEDVGAWLSVVARNLCISRLRKESRWVPLDAPATDVSDPSADPATTLEHRETRPH